MNINEYYFIFIHSLELLVDALGLDGIPVPSWSCTYTPRDVAHTPGVPPACPRRASAPRMRSHTPTLPTRPNYFPSELPILIPQIN